MKDWEFGPFKKIGKPIFEPSALSEFCCPIEGAGVKWEASNVYNPAVIVRDGVMHMIYRADGEPLGGIDTFGNKRVVCRLGHAISRNGTDFERSGEPVLYPDEEYKEFEWWGGVQDLHITEGEDGRYYMNYDAWTGHYNRSGGGFGKSTEDKWEDVLMSASSDDLIHWKKHGPALNDKWLKYYNHSRSGVVVSKIVGDKLIAARINGKYYMYSSHDGYLFSSDDLIKWDVELDRYGEPKRLFGKGEDSGYDSVSHEAGAAAVLTEHGIVYFYNSFGVIPDRVHLRDGGQHWALSQALINSDDLCTVIDKLDHPFIFPEYEWELYGHAARGCTVCNTMVKWKGKWRLYYGCADHVISMATEE